MRHARKALTAAETVARVRAAYDARTAVALLIGQKCRCKPEDKNVFNDAIQEARKDAESWEERNGK